MIQLELATPLGKALIEENGCSGAYCPEQPHDKGSTLYKCPTNRCKNNLESSTDPNGLGFFRKS